MNEENKLNSTDAVDDRPASCCSICDCCGKPYEPKPLKQLKKMTTACAECGVLRIKAVIMDDKEAKTSLRVRKLMGKHRAIKSGNAGITSDGEIVDRRNHPDAMEYKSNVLK